METTPSQDAVKEKSITFEGTDKRGRVISVRKPGMLAQYRMVGMLGKGADSEVYLNMCMPLIYLYAIDGDDDIPLDTVRQMETLICRLGNDGIACLMDLVAKNFSGGNEEKDKDDIKK